MKREHGGSNYVKVDNGNTFVKKTGSCSEKFNVKIIDILMAL